MKVILGALAIWLLARNRFGVYRDLATTSRTPAGATK